MFDGRVTLGICVFVLDWEVELGLEEVEADKEGRGGDKESVGEAGDEVVEELAEME